MSKTGISDTNWGQVGEVEGRGGGFTPESAQVETLSVIHAQGFPLFLKDASFSYWPGLENEQCTAALNITDVL